MTGEAGKVMVSLTNARRIMKEEAASVSTEILTKAALTTDAFLSIRQNVSPLLDKMNQKADAVMECEEQKV